MNQTGQCLSDGALTNNHAIISPSKSSEICKNYSRRSYGILKKTLVGNFEVIRFHGNDKLLHICLLK